VIFRSPASRSRRLPPMCRLGQVPAPLSFAGVPSGPHRDCSPRFFQYKHAALALFMNRSPEPSSFLDELSCFRCIFDQQSLFFPGHSHVLCFLENFRSVRHKNGATLFPLHQPPLSILQISVGLPMHSPRFLIFSPLTPNAVGCCVPSSTFSFYEVSPPLIRSPQHAMIDVVPLSRLS